MRVLILKDDYFSRYYPLIASQHHASLSRFGNNTLYITHYCCARILITVIYVSDRVKYVFKMKNNFSHEVKYLQGINFIDKASLLRYGKPPIVYTNIRLPILPITIQCVGTNTSNRYQKQSVVNKGDGTIFSILLPHVNQIINNTPHFIRSTPRKVMRDWQPFCKASSHKTGVTVCSQVLAVNFLKLNRRKKNINCLQHTA